MFNLFAITDFFLNYIFPRNIFVELFYPQEYSHKVYFDFVMANEAIIILIRSIALVVIGVGYEFFYHRVFNCSQQRYEKYLEASVKEC